MDTNRSDETSDLAIGRRGGRSVEDCSVNQPMDRVDRQANSKALKSPQKNLYIQRDLSEKTTNHLPSQLNKQLTPHPSGTPSFSTSAYHAALPSPPPVPPLSSLNMDHSNLCSPISLQESTISRLIDDVSLGNENDTHGSISALIGQFDLTMDQNNLTPLSSNDRISDALVPSVTSSSISLLQPGSQNSSTPKKLAIDFINPYPDVQNSICPRQTQVNLPTPLKTNRTSSYTNTITGCFSPQKTVHTQTHLGRVVPSPQGTPSTAPPASPLFSSPETTEQEEVYTILDEEVLSPVSVYNLKEKTVKSVPAEPSAGTPSRSQATSPTRVPFCMGSKVTGVWGSPLAQRGALEVMGKTEKECRDLSNPTGSGGEGVSQGYAYPSANGDHFPSCQELAGSSSMEVETNVDEDPLDMPLTSTRQDCSWGGRASPSKRQAIYQKHEVALGHNGYHDKSPLHYASQVQRPHCPSPLGLSSRKLLPRHAPSAGCHNTQPSAFRGPPDPICSHPSPVRLNSYPSPQDRTDFPHGDEEFIRSYGRPHSYNGHVDRQDDRAPHRRVQGEGVEGFQSASSTTECLSAMSMSLSNQALYSPNSNCNLAYTQTDYESFTPSSPSTSSRCTQSQTEHQTQPHIQFYAHTYNQPLPQHGFQVHHSAPLPQSHTSPSLAPPKPSPKAPTLPSPCKSKSLGDLTSEDISCNFQSKYHIISRSFITPSMRDRRRAGGLMGRTQQPQSADPLTEQLRKLVSLEDSDRDPLQRPCPSPQPPQLSLPPRPQPTNAALVDPEDDDCPPPLSRRLSSRSQSRVRHINSRARERQQEALKPGGGRLTGAHSSLGGVVLRHKAASQNPPVNRHSTGSYIAGYLDHLEDRGLPEGACTALRNGYGDHFGDQYYTDDSVLPADPSCSSSEPEVYFLLRL